jgi:hypothetical protein
MLVDEDEAVLGLGDDVGGGDLAARDAEGEAFGRWGRCGRGLGAGVRFEPSRVVAD